MTDVKFRVWDSAQRQFSSFAFDDLPSMAAFWCSDGRAERGGFIYQPYTGLRDKHGTEIYLDDVLQADLQRRYRVAWFDHSWALQEVGGPHAGYRHFKDAQHMTVIGNTSEHPEVVERPAGRLP
ncbi:MAG: hypothetical protein NVS2B7_29300 [Herpetosiphon sp.]